MDVEGLKWVVNFKLVAHAHGQAVNEGSDDTDNNGGPWLNSCATSGDGDQAGKDSVGEPGEVEANVEVLS